MAGDWASFPRPGFSVQERPACGRVNREEDEGVAFWKPAPGTREPGRCDPGRLTPDAPSPLARCPWRISFGQAGHASHLSLAAGVIVAVVTAAALPLRRVW